MSQPRAVLWALVTAFGLNLPIYGEVAAIPEIEEAKKNLSLLQEKAGQPLIEFQGKYEEALKRSIKESQNEGNLDGMLEFTKELETFRENDFDSKVPAKNDKLRQMQDIYRQQVEKISKSEADYNRKIVGEYIDTLEKVVETLTKGGEIQKALEVRKLIGDAQTKTGNSPPPTHSSPLPSDPEDDEDAVIVLMGATEDYATSGALPLLVNRDGGNHTLWSQGNATRILSKKVLKTPFRVEAKVMTDSNEIRMYYGLKGVVMFNRRAEDFRLHLVDPISGSKKNAEPKGSGELVPDQMHVLEIEVTNSRINILIDGQKRADLVGNYDYVEGVFGIGPSIGSTVTVEYFKGFQE